MLLSCVGLWNSQVSVYFSGKKPDIKNRTRNTKALSHSKWPQDANAASQHLENVREAVKTGE